MKKICMEVKKKCRECATKVQEKTEPESTVSCKMLVNRRMRSKKRRTEGKT